MEVDVEGNLWLNRWHHAPLARSCRRLWRHRRLFRHEMRMERRRRRSELCPARPHCSALNVNVFILGVDSLTTKTAKTMITAALMMVMSRKRRRRRVRGWPWRAQPRKWRRTRTQTDLGTRGPTSASSLSLDLDAIQPDQGSTDPVGAAAFRRPSVGIINMTCLFSVDSMRDVDGTERV